jgi:hypothetical protein
MEPESRKEGEGESPCLSPCATPSSQRIFPPVLLCYPAISLLLCLFSSPLSFSLLLFRISSFFSVSFSSLCLFVFSLFSLFISLSFPLLCLFYVSTSPLSLSPFYLPSSHFTIFPSPRLPLLLPLLLIPILCPIFLPLSIPPPCFTVLAYLQPKPAVSFFFLAGVTETDCTAPTATNYLSLRNSLNGCQGHLPPCLSPPDRPRVTKLDSNDVRMRSVLFTYQHR